MNTENDLREIANLICSSDPKNISEGYVKLNILAQVMGLIVCEEVSKYCALEFARDTLSALGGGQIPSVNESRHGWIDLMNATIDPKKKLHFYCCHLVINGFNTIIFKNILKLIT